MLSINKIFFLLAIIIFMILLIDFIITDVSFINIIYLVIIAFGYLKLRSLKDTY